MKNALRILCVLVVTTTAGLMLPAPIPPHIIPHTRWLGGLVATALAILVWGVFHLLEPVRYSYSVAWARVRIATISLIWVVLVTLLGIWFEHMRGRLDEPYYYSVTLSMGLQPAAGDAGLAQLFGRGVPWITATHQEC